MKSRDKIHAASEISLWLDSYDDIYSDFDSRNYLKRRISEDFIDELKASLKYKEEHTEDLILSLPAGLRKKEIEREIIMSMQEQFYHHFERLKHIDNKVLLKGLLFVVTGIIVMGIDSVIAYWVTTTYPTVLLRVVLEPAGWFLIWNGLDQLFYYYKKARKETQFYKKVAQLKIHFKNSDD